MTNEFSISEPLNHIPTRRQSLAEAKEEYRAYMLSQLAPKIYWLALPFIVIMANLLVIFRHDAIGIVLAVATNIACGYAAFHFYQGDRKVRILATLTPIYDKHALRAQIDVLASSVKLLVDCHPFADPTITQRGIGVIYGALSPLLARGPVTIETATVAGYPAYPDTDISTMPGDDSDFVSLHLLRIEASVDKFNALIDDEADWIFAEIISEVAGELIPPLRAIEAQIPKDSIAA